MKTMTKKQKRAATAALFARKGTAILGFPVRVEWLDDTENLGYTVGDRKKGYATVHVAWDFKPITEPMKLGEDEKAMLRMGVFAHELLHQVLTDFKDTYETCDDLGKANASVFMQFMNTLEDPAIEHQADTVFGGLMLNALKFSITTIYKSSPGIEVSPDAFTQLLNALINFGDVGLIKGHFTFPEAYEYFLKVAPLYNQGITERNSKKRIDISRECFDVTRPLWEPYLKKQEEDCEQFEKMIEELMKQLSSAMEPESEGRSSDDEDGSGSSDADGKPSDRDDSPESEARNKLLKAIAKAVEDGGQMPEDGQLPSADGNEDKETVSDDEEDTGDGSSLSDDSDENSGTSDSTEEDDKPSDSRPADNADLSSDGIRTPDISEKDIEEMNSLLEKEQQKLEQAEKECAGDQIGEIAVEGSALDRMAVVRNVKAEVFDNEAEEYNDIVKKNTGKIKKLARTLDKIFQGDKEEKRYAQSGSYNIMRGAAGTSARIFDKRRDPGNRKDCEVCLIVDMSGSMCGSKELIARETAIVFGEALMALKIPHYIMGYTGDITSGEGCEIDAYQTHFVTWNSNKRQHQSLVNIKAVADNYDSYAIRTAKTLLDRRSAKNKLLLIITDGLPTAMIYGRGSDSWVTKGLAETKQALKEASKSALVLGIAIGNDVDSDNMKAMYGQQGFIHIADKNGLTNVLIKRLAKTVKERFK